MVDPHPHSNCLARRLTRKASRHGATLLSAFFLFSLAGCQEPLRDEDSGTFLRSLALKQVQAEIDAGLPGPGAKILENPVRVDELGLPRRIMTQLESTSGLSSYQLDPLDLGPSLMGVSSADLGPLGNTGPAAGISLQRVILAATQNNLTVQFGRLVPAVSQAQLTRAMAAFDWTVVASAQSSNTDQEQVRTGTTNRRTPLLDQRVGNQLSLGMRRRLESGGGLTLQTGVEQTDVDFGDNRQTPNPANTASAVVQLDQPLMRGFGTDTNLAEVRLSINAERDAVEQLRATVTQTIVDSEVAYWQLVQSVGQARIAQRLLDRGSEVRDTLRRRQGTAEDVGASQFSDAVAQVEQRRSDVIRSQTAVRASSDRLKQLMNDPDLPLGDETLVLPVDGPVTEPLQVTLQDVVTTALANRPEIQRALLAINDATIRKQLADNARLPQLDLRLQARVSELDDDADQALTLLKDTRFIDYLVGVNFEQPLGNRAAEAGFRQRTAEAIQAQITYREVVQRILIDVKNNLRSVVSNYSLILQTKAARLAAAENLRTLEVEERTIQNLTPEFLDRKLRRQQGLAAAEIAELQALVEYNASIARLRGSMGVALQHNRIDFQAAPGQ
jgi:outer membrane protein